jgi:hypothetical protein
MPRGREPISVRKKMPHVFSIPDDIVDNITEKVIALFPLRKESGRFAEE